MQINSFLKNGSMRSHHRHHHAQTHGMTGTPTYISWVGMKQRCDNPDHVGYSDYGGRGITYCDRWFSFENFLEDMGERPAGHTLDRIDCDSGYYLENCRWATWIAQTRNRRSARLITHAGRTQCLAAWADEVDISPASIRRRIDYLGWSVERALTEPVRKLRNRRSARLITHAGRTQCLAAWSEEVGLPAGLISHRIDRSGWSVADALTTPTAKQIVFQGRSQSTAEWAEEVGMKENTLKNRIHTLGWSVERALTEPVRKLRKGRTT